MSQSGSSTSASDSAAQLRGLASPHRGDRHDAVTTSEAMQGPEALQIRTIVAGNRRKLANSVEVAESGTGFATGAPMSRVPLVLLLTATILSTAPAQSPAPPTNEVQAAKLLRDARSALSRDGFQASYESLRTLRRVHRHSTVFRESAEEIEKIWNQVAPRVLGPASQFLCDVAFEKDGRLTLTYDLMAWPEGFADFEDTPTIPDIKSTRVAGGSVSGTGGWCHRAIFTGDAAVTVEGTPEGDQDFGLVVVDATASPVRFLAAVANNSFFGVKYDETRRVTRGHLLIFCGEGAESLAKQNPSQILGEWQKPVVVRKESLTMGLSLRAHLAEFRIGTEVHKASTAGSSQTILRHRLGVGLRRATFRPTRVTITGKLDPIWAAEESKRIDAGR